MTPAIATKKKPRNAGLEVTVRTDECRELNVPHGLFEVINLEVFLLTPLHRKAIHQANPAV